MTGPRTLAALGLLAIVLAGCGGGGEADTAAEPTTDATDTAAGATAEPTTGAATVAVASTGLGDVLVDGEGRTLYLFTNDAEGSSSCYDDCAATWPPVVADGEPVAGEGADGALLGTTPRDDGDAQVTYGGHPLYLFAGDEAPGDTNGQGVGGVWFAVTAAGDAVEDGGDAPTAP